MQFQLRELQRSDLSALNRWRNDPDVVRHLGANFQFIGLEVDERWFDSYLAGRDRAVRLAVVDTERDRLLGVVYLTDIHRINRSAEFGIMIGEKDAWCRGVGTAATAMILTHGFDNLNLHRIYLSVLAENTRAIRVYEKVGFRQEGCQREAVFKGGRYLDVLLMAILASEYRVARSSGGA
jgi:UDP-4-amino-4,6-dideoxy-N-acetyl-beta-L-altrosamine N-acetyltransferase